MLYLNNHSNKTRIIFEVKTKIENTTKPNRQTDTNKSIIILRFRFRLSIHVAKR